MLDEVVKSTSSSYPQTLDSTPFCLRSRILPVGIGCKVPSSTKPKSMILHRAMVHNNSFFFFSYYTLILVLTFRRIEHSIQVLIRVVGQADDSAVQIYDHSICCIMLSLLQLRRILYDQLASSCQHVFDSCRKSAWVSVLAVRRDQLQCHGWIV
jgi:hypothetical protein